MLNTEFNSGALRLLHNLLPRYPIKGFVGSTYYIPKKGDEVALEYFPALRQAAAKCKNLSELERDVCHNQITYFNSYCQHAEKAHEFRNRAIWARTDTVPAGHNCLLPFSEFRKWADGGLARARFYKSYVETALDAARDYSHVFEKDPRNIQNHLIYHAVHSLHNVAKELGMENPN